MTILVTVSSGHLGEALVRYFRQSGQRVLGLDVRPSAHTDVVGSIADRNVVRDCMAGVHAVVHTATLHKPHVATHTKTQFVETNVLGTLHLLEEAADHTIESFVFTSTTSVYGHALVPTENGAVWVTENLEPSPRNIYGATKVAAEQLCALIQRERGLPVMVLRTSRFFLEGDDGRQELPDENVKAN